MNVFGLKLGISSMSLKLHLVQFMIYDDMNSHLTPFRNNGWPWVKYRAICFPSRKYIYLALTDLNKPTQKRVYGKPWLTVKVKSQLNPIDDLSAKLIISRC